MILGIFLMLFFCAVWGCPSPEKIAPFCMCRHVSQDYMMFCSNITNAEELISPLKASAPFNMFSLAIIDSSILYLPSGVFRGSRFKKVMFSNTQVMALSDSDLAFEGLEDHLEEIRANGASYITHWDWSQIQNLRRIDVIDINMISMYSLEEEFPRLDTLKFLSITKAELSFLHPTAFRQLGGLRLLSLKQNDLTDLARTMLPSPAPELTIIDISDNQLSSLPPDFFSDMPSLQEVELHHNKFSTLNEDTFTWPMENLYRLTFIGNDFLCDCRLRWLTNVRKPSQLLATCSQPDSLNGWNLKDLSAGSLYCL